MEKSRRFIGVIDEYGVLDDGEIFVQATNNNVRTDSFILDGDVIIAKNPCLHPGDVRKVKAVNRRELAHLFDVVVFPRKGKRPIQNMCSGSDLDGNHLIFGSLFYYIYILYIFNFLLFNR